jgi:hypothetical protein
MIFMFAIAMEIEYIYLVFKDTQALDISAEFFTTPFLAPRLWDTVIYQIDQILKFFITPRWLCVLLTA